MSVGPGDEAMIERLQKWRKVFTGLGRGQSLGSRIVN
jgi:hypothetical protein